MQFFNIKKLAAFLFVFCLGSVSAYAGWGSTDYSKTDSTSTPTTFNTTNTFGTPSGTQPITTIASNTADLSTLVTALQAADLVSVLDGTNGSGSYTVFAPTNDAFAALGDNLDTLMKPENKEKLRSILLYHVVPGTVTSNEIHDMNIKSVNGDIIQLRMKDGKVFVDDAEVIKADVNASNGVVHVIDEVIMPE